MTQHIPIENELKHERFPQCEYYKLCVSLYASIRAFLGGSIMAYQRQIHILFSSAAENVIYSSNFLSKKNCQVNAIDTENANASKLQWSVFSRIETASLYFAPFSHRMDTFLCTNNIQTKL